MKFKTVEDTIGQTPLVRLQHLPARLGISEDVVVLAKLEGNNPAGSVKDRAALSMIRDAEEQGLIKPGDTLIEPTSGNTGIALAMVATIRGYRMKIVMPDNLSAERRAAIRAFGAELILTPADKGGMEYARDVAQQMADSGEGLLVNQFANHANPQAHIDTTGPEIWEQTQGTVTHFVGAMGTTGTVMGNSQFLKSRNPDIQIVGVQPAEGASIPGIRKWGPDYEPAFYDKSRIDQFVFVNADQAEAGMRRLASTEGILAGVSSGGACHAAFEIASELSSGVIVFVVCDRGDRYLSMGIF